MKYIGIGEKIDDLQVFNREEFVDSLLNLHIALYINIIKII